VLARGGERGRKREERLRQGRVLACENRAREVCVDESELELSMCVCVCLRKRESERAYTVFRDLL